MPNALTTHDFRVTGMTCAACVGRVERLLRRLPGVEDVTVNLVLGQAQITASDLDESRLQDVLQKAGFTATKIETNTPNPSIEPNATTSPIWICLILCLPVFLLEMGGHLIPSLHHIIQHTLGDLSGWLQAALTTLIFVWPGRPLLQTGLRNLFQLAPDMNSLVALGAGAAWAYSLGVMTIPNLFPENSRHLYFESAAVIITLILIGRHLEARARGKARQAISALVTLQPTLVHRYNGDHIELVPLTDIAVGDLILVKPGERIAVDGNVIAGASYVDESMLTGESAPIHHEAGTFVSAGTLNQTGSLTVSATHVGASTRLSHIIQLVQQAQINKLPIENLVDRVTRVFVPAVMVIAVATFILWWVIPEQPSLSNALIHAISVLIVACPCAMGLATPMSIMVATGRAAQLGVLFRRGAALQTLADVKVIGFDKTGTLTLGKLHLTRLINLSEQTDEQLLQLAASAETNTEHPIGRALDSALTPLGLSPFPTQQFEAIPGRGIRAVINSLHLTLGNRAFMEESGIKVSHVQHHLDTLEKQGASPIFMGINNRLSGLFTFEDPLKPNAAEQLKRLALWSISTRMVTGDNIRVANRIANELAIDDVYAEVLPSDKANLITTWKRDATVAFVGDGINDAPALASADVGIAIGTGTDVAIESADVVLASGDLKGVVRAVELSKACLSNIRQNLFWAFAYNTALIPVAAGAFAALGISLSPLYAAAAMSLSSLFVVINSLRLRYVSA